MTSNHLKEKTPIGEIFNLNKCVLSEIADRLWFEYFYPATELTTDQKRFIAFQYNYIVTLFPKNILQKINTGMKWENTNGLKPDLEKAIYTEVKAKEERGGGFVGVTGRHTIEEKVIRVATVKKTIAVKGNERDQTILDLFHAGKSRAEIVELTGFNRNTVIGTIWRFNNSK